MELSRALVQKLAQRSAAMSVESQLAHGLIRPPAGFAIPPDWALAASRIALENVGKLLRIEDCCGPIQADQAGALVGVAGAWDAFLATPSAETRILEERIPVVAEVRARLAKISTPQIELGKMAEQAVLKAPLTAKERLDFTKGQYAGASTVLNERGEVQEESKVRSNVCYFIWLYWEDFKFFRSVSDVLRFFEEFAEEDVSRKHLEKICREIGLRFKGRGRPKNPTGATKQVGIRKPKTGVKMGDANSPSRRKSPD